MVCQQCLRPLGRQCRILKWGSDPLPLEFAPGGHQEPHSPRCDLAWGQEPFSGTYSRHSCLGGVCCFSVSPLPAHTTKSFLFEACTEPTTTTSRRCGGSGLPTLLLDLGARHLLALAVRVSSGSACAPGSSAIPCGQRAGCLVRGRRPAVHSMGEPPATAGAEGWLRTGTGATTHPGAFGGGESKVGSRGDQRRQGGDV